MAEVIKYLKHKERFFETSKEREKLFGDRCCVPLKNGERCKRKSIGWISMNKDDISKNLPDDDSKYNWIYIIRCKLHNDKCYKLQKYYKEQYRKIKPLANDKNKKMVESIRERFNALKLCDNSMKIPEIKNLIKLLNNNYKGRRKFDKECIYIKKYIPELKNIEPIKIHNWESLLNYYVPSIINYKEARNLALTELKRINKLTF